MSTPKKLKVYPSSSAFLKLGGVDTHYEAGCMRYLLIASKQKMTYFPPLYAKIGAYHETWYEAKLGDKLQSREVPLKHGLTELVEYSGRYDFMDVDGTVHETKASFSERFYYDVIRKGKYKLSHLAQLVSYLVTLNTTKGKISAGYYEQEPGSTEYVQTGYREFDVEIGDSGEVLVDGTPSGYTAQEQIAWQYAAAKVLETDTIGDRPANAWEKDSPCRFCPMASICDDYDVGEIDKDQFVNRSIEAIKAKRMPDPKVNAPKKRRLPK